MWQYLVMVSPPIASRFLAIQEDMAEEAGAAGFSRAAKRDPEGLMQAACSTTLLSFIEEIAYLAVRYTDHLLFPLRFFSPLKYFGKFSRNVQLMCIQLLVAVQQCPFFSPRRIGSFIRFPIALLIYLRIVSTGSLLYSLYKSLLLAEGTRVNLDPSLLPFQNRSYSKAGNSEFEFLLYFPSLYIMAL